MTHLFNSSFIETVKSYLFNCIRIPELLHYKAVYQVSMNLHL